MRILVVAAHPDDEVLGCGGTIARLVKEGHEISVGTLGEGVTSRYDGQYTESQSEKETLHDNCRKAAGLLNVKNLFLHNLPDNRFDTVPLLDIIKIVEKLIGQIKPAVICTHSPGDLNIDHVLTHRAVITAARPISSCPVKDIYAFEVVSSSEWAFQQFEPVFKPNVFVDISETIDKKIKAMQMYESEARVFPHPRSPEALKFAARRWGSAVGCEYAEAFELIRSIR